MGSEAAPGMLSELTPDDFLASDQDDFHSQRLGGPNRAFDFGLGRVIGAHGVNSDCHHNLGKAAPGLLFLGNFDDFTPVILPAMGADAVRQARLVTGRALGKRGLR